MDMRERPPVQSAADFVGLVTYLFVVGGGWSQPGGLAAAEPAERKSGRRGEGDDRRSRPAAPPAAAHSAR